MATSSTPLVGAKADGNREDAMSELGDSEELDTSLTSLRQEWPDGAEPIVYVVCAVHACVMSHAWQSLVLIVEDVRMVLSPCTSVS